MGNTEKWAKVEGLLQDGIVQSVRVRYLPERGDEALTQKWWYAIQPLYALSGTNNQSGLMRWQDLKMLEEQFDYEISPSMFAGWREWIRVKIDFTELKPMLEARPINNYQITVSNFEENGLTVREYAFELLKP